MNKRIWINIGLLFLIILLVILVNLPEQQSDKAPQPLTQIDPATITHIEVTRKGLDNFVFDKEDNSWQITAPIHYRSNQARIDAILKLLKTDTHSQFDPAQYDLATFNLKDPDIIVKLNDHTFSLGITDAIDQRRYVLYENTVYLIEDFLYKQLTTNIAFFADTKLLPEDFKVKEITFPNNHLSKIDDRWQLQNPLDIKPDDLARIPFSWENTVAISVSKYDVSEHAQRISLHSNNDEIISFTIVSQDPYLSLGLEEIGLQFNMGSDEAVKLIPQEKPVAE